MKITSQVGGVCSFSKGVSVEAELGTVGGEEDGVVGEGIIYANPQECKALVRTNCD